MKTSFFDKSYSAQINQYLGHLGKTVHLSKLGSNNLHFIIFFFNLYLNVFPISKINALKPHRSGEEVLVGKSSSQRNQAYHILPYHVGNPMRYVRPEKNRSPGINPDFSFSENRIFVFRSEFRKAYLY